MHSQKQKYIRMDLILIGLIILDLLICSCITAQKLREVQNSINDLEKIVEEGK